MSHIKNKHIKQPVSKNVLIRKVNSRKQYASLAEKIRPMPDKRGVGIRFQLKAEKDK